MEPTIELARKLIVEQFPEWSNLEIKHVQKSGHDNRTFRLGDTMSIRLPSHEAYAPQVEKEAKWLPMLAPHFDLPITVPIAKGKPSRFTRILGPSIDGLKGKLLTEATLIYNN